MPDFLILAVIVHEFMKSLKSPSISDLSNKTFILC